jgi:hypothetical protein
MQQSRGMVANLRTTLRAVAEWCGHPVFALSEALAKLADRQRSCEALRERASFTPSPSDRWTDLPRGSTLLISRASMVPHSDC